MGSVASNRLCFLPCKRLMCVGRSDTEECTEFAARALLPFGTPWLEMVCVVPLHLQLIIQPHIQTLFSNSRSSCHGRLLNSAVQIGVDSEEEFLLVVGKEMTAQALKCFYTHIHKHTHTSLSSVRSMLGHLAALCVNSLLALLQNLVCCLLSTT